jgi:exopolyphosphatase/guanosine-5'-triphosphate,3'-diphosphate pyrophosphatase
MKIAVIDLGTNTFDLLVASRSLNGRLIVHHEEEAPVFLGRGGIEKGMIAEDAFARGSATLETFRNKVLSLGAEQVHGFGTAALRNARNGKDFVLAARRNAGVEVVVVPGEEEAELILDGVRQAVSFGPKPMLVMDIGGGSVEFILATDRSLMWRQSFELGTTRLLERFPMGDPMTLDEQLRIAQYIDARLGPLWAVMDRHWPQTLVGSAGSFDTLASMIAASGGRRLGTDEVTMEFSTTVFDELKDRLLPMTKEEHRKADGLSAHRVETILPALIITERVLLHGIRKMHWSRYALKEGAAARILGIVPVMEGSPRAEWGRHPPAP